MDVELPKETRARLVASIRRYFDEELDREIGELQATLLLGYCLEEIGPSVYNQAIADARAYFFGKVEDLEGSCWRPELPYWERHGRR